ncbi:hypothetical protein HHL11_31065 [Ramlibacter sp. G-1-2-2]|uniref:Uncharacterized protein n=1 Tax=Ramlibacter agri TaxID=2728837 RepID=A0A848HFJ0_9BURK|nr:hypothetical protein [Ramlibacter agri]NML48230.1 hypothetical protein [Ramlibacter agri]
MLMGLWLDSRAGGLARLAALCTAGEAESVDVLGWHWSQLPRAHFGMLAGSLLPVLALPGPGAAGRWPSGSARRIGCTLEFRPPGGISSKAGAGQRATPGNPARTLRECTLKPCRTRL